MVMIMRNLTSLPLVMGLTVLYCVCRIVTFMKALSLAVGLMDTAIPTDMKIATTTILALGSEVLTQNEVMVNRPGAIEDMAGMAILRLSPLLPSRTRRRSTSTTRR